ncbi:MAG: GAF domain-containing protein [Desulfobacterales bacterium]
MAGSNWLMQASLKKRRLNYFLYLIFGLLFFLPTSGLLLFGYRHGIFSDRFLALLLLGVLVLSWIGIHLLRNIFETIRELSDQVKSNPVLPQAHDTQAHANELAYLVDSFGLIERHFSQTLGRLEKQSSDISILKEVAQICTVTFDPGEILQVTLERCLRLTGADMGSILILEPPERDKFVVKATMGIGDRVKIGDQIDFETSLAKYAVINKTSLVVQDIENDARFGRKNRPHYGSKGFVCVPLKSMNTIIGVLTLSSQKPSKTFNSDCVEVLTPLLSTAILTYDNLRLIKTNRRKAQTMGTIAKIFNLINSAPAEGDLIHGVLSELKPLVDFRAALLLLQESAHPPVLRIVEVFDTESQGTLKGQTLILRPGSLIQQVMGRGRPLLVGNPASLKHDLDRRVILRPDCRGYLLTPLKYDGRIQGLLIVAAKETQPLRAHREIISWVNSGLGYALERQKLAQAVNRRDQELESIKQIGTVLASSTFDSSKVLHYTLPMIQVTMDVSAGAIFMLQGGRMTLKDSYNLEAEKAQVLNAGLDSGLDSSSRSRRGIVGYIAARGETLRINSRDDALLYIHREDELQAFGAERMLGVPIISQGKVIGVILVINKLDGDFSANDEDVLQSIAASVSIALENARLYASMASMAGREREIRQVFQKFAPKEVLEKMLQKTPSGTPGVEEYKALTLLNVDLRGFSPIAARLGPRKTVALLNHFFEVMGKIVFDHQGIVDKYLGDGFLALFGAPGNLPDHADQALDSALKMREALPAVNRELQRQLQVAVEIGISVHTGSVVVGNIGFEMKMDYTVIGDAVNTVFRMQDLARSYTNCILISDETYKSTAHNLEVTPLPEPVKLTGIPDPLKIYELMGAGKRSTA